MTITHKIVRELLHYDPEAGIFTWRERDQSHFADARACKSWNARFAGRRAGCTRTDHKNGFRLRQIRLHGSPRYEHRLAWLYMTDATLPEEIDHKNRNATDNRWCNLRASSNAENQRNQSMPSNNTSGVTGVYWNKQRSKWMASCMFSGKNNYLGYFDDLDEAAKIVADFRAKHGFDPDHGKEIAHYHAS